MEQDSQVPPQFHGQAFACMGLGDNTLNDNLPPLQPKPENGRSHIRPATGLGALDALSLELLTMILGELDLYTFFNFGSVNRRAADVVDQVPVYKDITKHALCALRGILSINTERWITCRTLYEKLFLAECEVCGDFAGYLYLITCKRVCFICLSRDISYLPLTPQQAWSQFGLSSAIVDTLPWMRVVPGIYSPHEVKIVEPTTLVDYKSCLDKCLALYGSFDAMRKHMSDMETRELPGVKAGELESEPSIPQPLQAGPIKRSGRFSPRRCVAITRMPWLNQDSKQLEWGFYCLGVV
ncbi:uncharacterized protein NECHADRAFT_87452 [Fusarium vanettenii 77-13-4]|uniref:F-box domain-containing protein n=1 Tax=Fusarium vanettenii (strain ATCC MYA-4622 / CBS 123669 / FGSC 9596 / NRRL 45880 / 77-13-4) TaxID=660122 RepID=C7ZE58_FUSV7|nr:uncharacterized protein NECHADRAFT_87452 [Fusarium vanettenii 77-13-4]EEU37574.1 hypothetical protein NECHADRAFT_87452 [Fusarium vanettenii 77-13-4]